MICRAAIKNGYSAILCARAGSRFLIGGMLSSRDRAQMRLLEVHGNAKLARSRLHGRRAVTRSKRRSRAKNVSIRRLPERLPPELLAPITAEVEHQLKQSSPKFGEKKVREALDPLITNVNGTIGNAWPMRSAA